MSLNEPLLVDNEALDFANNRIHRANTLSVVNRRQLEEASFRRQNHEIIHKMGKKTRNYILVVVWLTLCLSGPRIFGGSLVPECS